MIRGCGFRDWGFGVWALRFKVLFLRIRCSESRIEAVKTPV